LHRTALKELADGLRAASVGAVSGNRWYLPPEASLSGLTRMLWNGFAVPAMNMVGILWGGCLAARASDFRNSELRQLLASSFIEDSTVATTVTAEVSNFPPNAVVESYVVSHRLQHRVG